MVSKFGFVALFLLPSIVSSLQCYSCNEQLESGSCDSELAIANCPDGSAGCFVQKNNDRQTTERGCVPMSYNTCQEYQSDFGCQVASQLSRCYEGCCNTADLCNSGTKARMDARAHAVLVTLLLVIGMVAVRFGSLV